MPAIATLQTASQWSTTASPESTMTFLGIVVALVVFFVIYGMRNNGGGSPGFSLRKACRQHDLTPDHYRILKHAVKDLKIQSPSALFSNGRLLNGTLKQLLLRIEASEYPEGTKEALKAELFEIKARITRENPAMRQTVSTKTMAMNQAVTLYSRSYPPFRSEVTGKTPEVLAVDLPQDSQGEWIQYKVGSPLKVRYIRDEDKVFSFVSTIKDIREIEGSMKILLAHTNEVKRIQLRKSPRREFHRSTFFYKVDIVSTGTGRKATRSAQVQKNRRFQGSMEDISAGGCALFTRTPLQGGTLIMLSFDISKGTAVNVFGKVRNVRREKTGTLMHVMFTKISTKHLNEIRSFIYGFTEDEEKPRNHYLQ